MIDNSFAKILEEVVTSLPGALGALFIDWEGEAVDGYSAIGNTNLRIVGAHWGISYYQAHAIFKKLALASPNAVILRFADQQVIIRRVTEEYLVILALQHDANQGYALYRLKEVEDKLRKHM
jgi:predicted regulator of Ras-like GTPase activity (Roadblock/LC7/MglB family)